jgi:hypothetical protein
MCVFIQWSLHPLWVRFGSKSGAWNNGQTSLPIGCRLDSWLNFTALCIIDDSTVKKKQRNKLLISCAKHHFPPSTWFFVIFWGCRTDYYRPNYHLAPLNRQKRITAQLLHRSALDQMVRTCGLLFASRIPSPTCVSRRPSLSIACPRTVPSCLATSHKPKSTGCDESFWAQYLAACWHSWHCRVLRIYVLAHEKALERDGMGGEA